MYPNLDLTENAKAREKDPASILWEAGWVPGSVWTGAQYLAPPGFDSQPIQPVVSSNVIQIGSCQVFMAVVDQMLLFFWVYVLYSG